MNDPTARDSSAPAPIGSDQSNDGLEFLRRLEEEETRRGGMEEGRERLRTSLYQPSEELLALSGRFIGAAMDVHTHLGAGFTEGIYHEALCLELERRGMPFASEVVLDVMFKGDRVGQFRIDLIVDGRLVVELKAVEQITSVHTAQVISYLRASGNRYGLILNFNVAHLHQGIRRVLWSR